MAKDLISISLGGDVVTLVLSGVGAYEAISILTGIKLVNPDPLQDFIKSFFQAAPSPAPEPITCSIGYHLEGSTCVKDPIYSPPPIITPPPVDGTVPSLFDNFGVRKLYRSKVNGENWFMNAQSLLSDIQVLETSNITAANTRINPDGSVKFTFPADSSNRLNILTSGGYNHALCELDWNKLIQRGYMQNPQDWRNVEMTAYVRVNTIHSTTPGSTGLVWYARGGHHSNSYPCEGSSYKGNIMHDGTTRFQKEMGHNSNVASYYPTSKINTPLTGAFLGKWFGYKFCVYDLASGDVKLENWLDVTNNNNWVKVNETTDNGIWGQNTSNCGGVQSQKFVWGGPQAVFRFDSVGDIDFAKMSIREIV